jgi:hypothetical protein
MSGEALGSETFRKICIFDALNDLISWILSFGTFSSPTIVLMSTGKNPMAMAMTIFEVCP